MRIKIIMIAALLSPLPSYSQSVLQGSEPAHQSVVSPAPKALDLTFESPIRLSSVKFGIAGSDLADLDIGKSREFKQEHSVNLYRLGKGVFVIEWRGVKRNHEEMQGKIEFTVE